MYIKSYFISLFYIVKLYERKTTLYKCLVYSRLGVISGLQINYT